MNEKIPEKSEEYTDVEYTNAPLHKRWFAGIIDIFVMAIIALLLYGLSMIVTEKVPAYQKLSTENDKIQLDSGLYVKDGDKNRLLTFYLDDSEKTDKEKKEAYSKALDEFYVNSLFFEDDRGSVSYQERKKVAVDDKSNLIFVLSGTEYVENGYSDTIYCSFYKNEIEKYASAQLSLNSKYSDNNRMIVIVSISELFICGAFGFSFSFILMPLFIKRGRRTIGMYLFKISLIGVDALNVRGKTLVARNFLLFFVGYVLSVFTVLIPLIVSITMMHLSKTHQDFFDYITNTYVVDTVKQDVYLNFYEYDSRKGMKKEASIEKVDFKLTDRR